jgi:hypothetical protein
LQHHELAKNNGRQFQAMKGKKPEHHYGLTIDYIEAYTLTHQRQIQQEHFSQLGMSICAVSVAVHVCDCENIGDEEKAALLQPFHALVGCRQ